MEPVFKSTPIYRRENHGFVWCLINLLIVINMGFWWYSLLGYQVTESVQSFIGNEAPRHLKPVLIAKSDVVAYIAQKSYEAGISPILALQIAFCESSYSYSATHPKSSAKGLFGILKGTQLEVEKATGKKYDPFLPEDNIEMFVWQYNKYKLKPWLASKRCWSK